MGDWNANNLGVINRILRIFYLCSGLKINIHKSVLFGLGVVEEEVRLMANFLGCKIGSLPFTYLGVKVGANMNRISNWDPVVDTIQNRLCSWKSKLLSIGGRLTLLKAVLASLPVYYLSIYKAPATVIDKIEKMMRKFLWVGCKEGRGMHWVCWDIVTKPKKEGGLGVSKLVDVNTALLARWAFRFKSEVDSMWRRVIESIHGGRNRWVFLPVKNSIPGCWKSIVTYLDKVVIKGISLQSQIRGKLGNGADLRFWLDLWIGTVTLKDRWPALFEADKDKNDTVGSRVLQVDNKTVLADSWVMETTTVQSISEAQDARFLLPQVRIVGVKDRWVWEPDKDGTFSVAAVKKWLADDGSYRPGPVLKWESWIPIKVNVFAWRMIMDRLPTREALVRRMMNLSDVSCPLCDTGCESLQHLIVDCGVSYGVWSFIWKWCRYQVEDEDS
ncbi:putative reverse transcriptase zinc-binding domain-containing protein [Helianthus annuus]|nr:putative reverse transcriptase zinc-binding domain-containing protein [Helianthus annuus]